MKKRSIAIILLISLIEFLIIAHTATAFGCTCNYLETDKDSYYMDEKVRISASWELGYDPLSESAYVQIEIFNFIGKKIWNSSEYHMIGQFMGNWDVPIDELNNSYFNYSNTFFIKFSYYYNELGGNDGAVFYLKEIQIEVIKRIPVFQLIGFKNRIKFGERLTFNVEFFDPMVENNSHLINQHVLFRISSNYSLIFHSNFTTNELGNYEISISSPMQLSIGENHLEFELIDNEIYNNTIFSYELFVERNIIRIDVITFEETLDRNENLTITLFYYFFRNNTLIPLINQFITLEILDHQDLAYASTYKTDTSGILSINLPQNSFNFNKDVEELKLDLIFNGTDLLENLTFSLNLVLCNPVSSNKINSNLLVFFSIMILISLISLTFFYKFKKNKTKLLADITIRY
ncbi:MAG: hypothetical protein ACFFEN_02295 [Candidatus Thorarchaeota archaeon]